MKLNKTFKIAIIGDVHGFFDEMDTEYFNKSDYDIIIFVGDLEDINPSKTKLCFENISKLTKLAYLIPGNWDSTSIFSIAGEALHSKILKRIGKIRFKNRLSNFEKLLPNLKIEGYSKIEFKLDANRFCLVFGRPYSMGGSEFQFKHLLKERFNIETIGDSISKMKEVIDSIEAENLIFISHNGPYGLGSARTDICGADFKKDGGDFGDKDLTLSIEYAIVKGKKVIANVFGHMHRFENELGKRIHYIERSNIKYINTAAVPRIINSKRYHLEILLSNNETTFTDKWV